MDKETNVKKKAGRPPLVPGLHPLKKLDHKIKRKSRLPGTARKPMTMDELKLFYTQMALGQVTDGFGFAPDNPTRIAAAKSLRDILDKENPGNSELEDKKARDANAAILAGLKNLSLGDDDK